jgi:hypothetical protein
VSITNRRTRLVFVGIYGTRSDAVFVPPGFDLGNFAHPSSMAQFTGTQGPYRLRHFEDDRDASHAHAEMHATLTNGHENLLRRRTDSAARCLFAQPEMGSVVMIVRDILGQKPPEMALVQGDDVIEQVAPTTANPAFRNSVLPGALDGGLEANNAHGPNRRGNYQPVLGIVIEDEKLGCRLVRKRFPQLLHNPGAGRVACDIEV